MFTAFLWSIPFSLSAFLTINTPIFFLYFLYKYIIHHPVFRKFISFLFISINSILIVLNIIDSGYFPFTLKRISADFFSFVLSNQSEFILLFWDFIKDYPWHSLSLIIILLLFIFTIINISIENNSKEPFRILIAIKSLLLIAVILIFIRGPYERPLSIVDAGRYSETKLIPFVLNTPFTIIHTLNYQSLDSKDFFKEEQLSTLFSPIHHYSSQNPFRKKNIIIIILESFSKEYSAYLNPRIRLEKKDGYTPFLDSLMKLSTVFDGYANGKTSAEGVPAVLTGIPTLMEESFIFSQYSSNKMNSFATYLKTKSYYTAFFHGGTNGTMNFEAFSKIIGYDNYFGRTEYNNDKDFDGNWGIFDGPFLQYFSRKMDRFQQPFSTILFTLSSHHPYTIPKTLNNKFAEGSLPIHKSIQYSDYSLKEFFKTAQKSEWFANSIFVFSADHTAISRDKFFSNSLGQYAIPIFIYDPQKEPRRIHKIISQTDILPSVLDYLHFSDCNFSFGNSIYNSKVENFCINYRNGRYQIITDSIYASFDGNDIHIKSLYKYNTDSLLRKNLKDKEKKLSLQLENKVKAYIQQYNNRMIQNKLDCTN